MHQNQNSKVFESSNQKLHLVELFAKKADRRTASLKAS